MLEIKGVDVIACASNVNDAGRLCLEKNPDVIILDIRMPGGSGISLLKEVKSRDPRIVVMMFTSFPYGQYRKKCLEYGADFFFDKSSEFPELIRTVQELVPLDPLKSPEKSAVPRGRRGLPNLPGSRKGE